MRIRFIPFIAALILCPPMPSHAQSSATAQDSVAIPPGPDVFSELVPTPPPPRIEEPPVVFREDTSTVLVPGAWEWKGTWVWSPGHWEHPPLVGLSWVGPSYALRGAQGTYTPGHWSNQRVDTSRAR